MLQPSALLLERYRIIELHEMGRENPIYRAYDETLAIEVAVKENSYHDPAHRRQFELEAVFLANLNHPNIPKALDYGDEDGRQFFVMDFIEGTNLQQLMQQRKPDTEEILRWAATMCDILAYLHSAYSHKSPIIHQDIEPSNIILTPDSRIILVDFGFAKVYKPEGDRLAPAKPSIPSPAGVKYTAIPDAQMARVVIPLVPDRRSDQYSLAATLYTLLTGVPPLDSMERMKGKPRLAPIRPGRPDLSASAEEAIFQALSLDQNKRFSNIEDFKSALIAKN